MNPFATSNERGRTTKLRRRRDGAICNAYHYKSHNEPLPHWLHGNAKVRPGTIESPPEVQVITGRWWAVNPDDWIIVHGSDVWLIENIDLGHTHDEVKR